MSRRSRIWITIVVGVAAGCGLGGVASALPTAAPAPTAARAPVPVRTLVAAKAYPADLLVYAQEWSLWPSRTRIPAGTIDVELWNRGEDAHDLRVRRVNAAGAMVGRVLGAVSTTPSGAIHHGVWRLGAGRYEIYCSLPGHLMMGMHTLVTVTG